MKWIIALREGTAVCIFSAALCVIAAPSAAQTYGTYGSNTNPPQYSTPEEQQQTRQLNEQAVDGTTQSPAVLNGEAQPNPSAAPSYANPPSTNYYGAAPPAPEQYGSPAQTPPTRPSPYAQNGDAQTQYQVQQQQYDEQQNAYQNREQAYEAQRGRYESNIRAYDRAMYDWAYPAAIAYRYDGGGLEPLYLIAEPSQQLFQIPVEDPGGRWVGRVRNVETAPDGRPARVEVALNRRVSVWVQPGDLRYDPDAHVLFTDLSRPQLWQLPGATVESGSY